MQARSPGNSTRDNAAPARLIAATADVALARALQALAEDLSIVIVDDLRKLTDEMFRHGSNLALIDSAIAGRARSKAWSMH